MRACIARVAKIVKDASLEGPVVTVVSAMSGVTNRLIEAAKKAEAGERDPVAAAFETLRKQHHAALETLIQSKERRSQLASRVEAILDEGERLCKGTALLARIDTADARCGFEPGRKAFRTHGGRSTGRAWRAKRGR